MFHRYGSENGGFSEYIRSNYSGSQNDRMFDYTDIPLDKDVHMEDKDADNTKRELFIFQVLRNIIQKIK